MALTVRTSALTPRPLQLHAGEVLRIEKRMAVTNLRVIDGMVWATTTPADGDLILRAGDTLTDLRDFPLIVQALSDTVLAVSVPARSHISLPAPAASPAGR